MPLIVISDASPIRALHHLNLLSLCHDLYGSVIIPAVVQRELLSPTTTCPAINIANFPHFEVRAATSNPAAMGIPDDLDPGECEAMTLAIELHADILLMDERKATEAARQLGLLTIGVFGILLEAKRNNLIPKVVPLIDQLVSELNFFASSALRQKIAKLANE